MRESQHKRLTRSGSDRMIAGVFGGIGQYFKIQPNILRILYVFTDYFLPVLFQVLLSILFW